MLTLTLIPTLASVTVCFCSSCHQFTTAKVEVYTAFSVCSVSGYAIVTSNSFKWIINVYSDSKYTNHVKLVTNICEFCFTDENDM